MPPIVSQSSDPKSDSLLGNVGLCGHAPNGGYQDRCGYGPRLPLLIISPYAKINFIDHGIADQSSILHFIEDNWALGRIGNQSFDSKAGSLMNMFDFKSHLISYAEAIQRYKQDSGNLLSGIPSTAKVLATQDYQNVRTGVQYMNDNCRDAIPALQNDPTLVDQMATLTAPTTNSTSS
jgi:hypothetical protein